MLEITLVFALSMPSADPDAAAALALAQAGEKPASKAICGPGCTACDCAITGICTCAAVKVAVVPSRWYWDASAGGYWYQYTGRKNARGWEWQRWSEPVTAAPPVPAIRYATQPVTAPLPWYQPLDFYHGRQPVHAPAYAPAYTPQINYGTSDYGAAPVFAPVPSYPSMRGGSSHCPT